MGGTPSLAEVAGHLVAQAVHDRLTVREAVVCAELLAQCLCFRGEPSRLFSPIRYINPPPDTHMLNPILPPRTHALIHLEANLLIHLEYTDLRVRKN